MKKIMIVEDEAAIREFEAINLKRVGYTVIEPEAFGNAYLVQTATVLGVRESRRILGFTH